MIFANMQALGLTAVGNVVKVRDTISDIKEGVNAGVWTAGVIEGSSELGLSQQENLRPCLPRSGRRPARRWRSDSGGQVPILLSGICPSYQIWFMLAALRT